MGIQRTLAPATNGSVQLQKGSVFHLRYLCDTFRCFPKKCVGYPVSCETVLTCPAHVWLLAPGRPDVIAVPLFLDRDHLHRDQLRACRLPLHSVVDGKNTELAQNIAGFVRSFAFITCDDSPW